MFLMNENVFKDIKKGQRVKFISKNQKKNSIYPLKGEGVVEAVGKKYILIRTKKGYALSINDYDVITGDIKLMLTNNA